MRGPKGILVFVVDENEKRTRGLFGHVCDHDSCVILFLPHTQCYSTIVAQSITCRKIQIYILCLELILNDPLRLFILSKTYRGHLLISSWFGFMFVSQLHLCTHTIMFLHGKKDAWIKIDFDPLTEDLLETQSGLPFVFS